MISIGFGEFFVLKELESKHAKMARKTRESMNEILISHFVPSKAKERRRKSPHKRSIQAKHQHRSGPGLDTSPPTEVGG